MSKGHHDAPEEPAPLPQAAPEPAPTPPKPPTLEERVARLEAYLPRLEAILGPVSPPHQDQPPAGG